MTGDLAPYISRLHASFLASDPKPGVELLGTLVFADVSGFTPLAERLAKRGKVGAEELTDTLNTVFHNLLEVADRRGGDCLKFGGDALLLLFSGDSHERRGAAAAHEMLAALRALRRSGSGAGLAKLNMSIGVQTGPVHGLAVGRTHRELLLAGAGVAGVLELETQASGGQILVSEETARALDPGDVERVDSLGWLLRRPPSSPPAGGHDDAAPVDHQRGIPEAVRVHLDGVQKDGEHRLGVIGFLKFGGTDRMLQEEGGLTLLGALDELISVVQQCCASHGVTFLGTDVDRDGGKIILVSGIPTASPDDEDRLLLTLSEVLVAARGCRLDLRAGVNRGRIFAVDLGGSNRRTFTVMGDAVNLAARVMGQASWGQVVATDEVLERARTDFALEQLPPFTVKGKSQPIRAHVVGAPRGRRDDATPGARALIGRAAELGLIEGVLAEATSGRGGIVELVGDPGIGKSRLVATLAELAGDLAQFRFEAGRYSLGTPFFALRRGLRRAMGLDLDAPPGEAVAALTAIVERAAPHLLPLLPLLAVPLGLELPDTTETAQLDPTNRQARLHSAVVELMELVLAEPTLITIEDSHWLDEASCELLRSMLSGAGARPWMVLITRRDVPGGLELDLPVVTRLRLDPLEREDLAALASSITGGVALPPGVLDELIERSGGNPLFLQELVLATASGALADLPDSIEAVVGATIDALPVDDRSLLRHAAVLGGRFPTATLAAMLELPADRLLAELRRLAHYLSVDQSAGFASFRHILLRDVAYEALPYRSRRRLHAMAAEIIEATTAEPDAMAELLCIHFHRAGRAAESWRYSCVAGNRAVRNGAPVEAAAFFGYALEAARSLPEIGPQERAKVAEQLGDTWELAGRYEQASAAYRQARTLADADPLRLAELHRKTGWVRDHEGRYTEAKRWYARGLRELDRVADGPEARALRSQLLTASVSADLRRGRHARSIPLMERAVEEATSSGDQAATAYAYYVFDQVLVEHGRLDDARYSELAAPLYEELGDGRGAASAYNELGNIAYWQGRWDVAVSSWERALESDRRAGALVNNAIYLNNIAEVRSDQGLLVEAESLLLAAHDLWAGGGWRIGEGWAMSNLGRVASRDGRQDDAVDRFRRAIEVFAGIGADAMLLETEARDLERLVFAGDSGDVLARAPGLRSRAKAMAAGHLEQMVERIEGYAWSQAGDPKQGRALLDASLAGSRARGAEYEIALTLEALVRIAPLLQDLDSSSLGAEASAAFARLGVVTTPEVPLP